MAPIGVQFRPALIAGVFAAVAAGCSAHPRPAAGFWFEGRGVGRGIGRAAAHEIGHQILGRAMRDDKTDIDSYEYFSADRNSQYFGTLHWTTALPLLQQKLSTRR